MARVGPYELQEALGEGGAGAVHRAVHSVDGAVVALKVLLAPDERARRRLVHEAKALTRLRHPGIVGVLDAGEDQGRPYLALELVRGRSLEERLEAEGPLPPDEAAVVLRDVARALAHAHAEGVVHRDVKPGNVLLPRDGGPPKLGDFGLAGFTADAELSRMTRSGAMTGSPGFAAPEQIYGRLDEIGPATDVYGLGATLYAALAGRAPIEGASLTEVIIATADRVPEPPPGDPALGAIALRCLEKRPSARFGSAEEVARALEAWLASRSHPAAAGAPPVLPLALGVLAAGVLAVVVTAATAVVVLRGRATRADPPPPLPAAEPSPGTPAPPAPAPGTAPRPETAAAPLPGPAPPLPAPELTLLTDPPPRVAAAPPPARVASTDGPRALGAERLRAGDLAGALAALDEAVRQDGHDVEALRLRALACLGRQDTVAALADLDEAIELAPRSARLFRDRGALRRGQRSFELGRKDIDRAIALDPGDPASWRERCQLRGGQGDLEGALSDADLAVKLDPSQAESWRLRGVMRLNAKNRDAAREDLAEAVRLSPDDPAVLQSQAAFLFNLEDDPRAALVLLNRALEKDPKNIDCLIDRGVLHRRLENPYAAIVDLDQAIALRPREAEAWSERGAARSTLEDHAGALADLDQSILLDPTNGLTWARRGRVRWKSGDPEGARQDVQHGLRLEPAAKWAAEARAFLEDELRSSPGGPKPRR